MNYNVIYDGTCNLCVTLVQLLENLDQGQRFEYIPMQDLEQLSRFGITSGDCEMGMILIDGNTPERRWVIACTNKSAITAILCLASVRRLTNLLILLAVGRSTNAIV